MATVTQAVLARASAATSSATLYTVPSTTAVAVVTNIVLANTATSASSATIAIDGKVIVPTVSIPANSLVGFDLKQVIPASGTPKTITGYASTTAVTIHISGVEIA
jgi:hypothetical protein